MVFVDIVKYLKEKLAEISDFKYNISTERNLDSDDLDGEIVVKALSGSVYDESSTIPYQIEVTSLSPDKVINDFTTLSVRNNNKKFTSIVKNSESEYQSYTITPFFQTPTIMDSDLRVGSNVYARLVLFATFNITYQVSDIKSITIDGESLSFLNATISYATEPSSNRISGVELSKSKIRNASTSISIDIVHKATIFTNKVFKIMTNQMPKNTPFVVEIEMENGLKASLTMCVNTCSIIGARGLLPTEKISLILYDERGN